jgi:hypothetical protein
MVNPARQGGGAFSTVPHMAMLFITVSNLHPRARIAAPQKALAPLCTIGPVSLGGLAFSRLLKKAGLDAVLRT